jgi:hypothetical protein
MRPALKGIAAGDATALVGIKDGHDLLQQIEGPHCAMQ